MPVTDADVRAWAEKHGIVLSATRLRGDTWTVEAKASGGILTATAVTDGSYEPDPFEWLFGVWQEETPGSAEFAAAVNALGPSAVADLALLLGL